MATPDTLGKKVEFFYRRLTEPAELFGTTVDSLTPGSGPVLGFASLLLVPMFALVLGLLFSRNFRRSLGGWFGTGLIVLTTAALLFPLTLALPNALTPRRMTGVADVSLQGPQLWLLFATSFLALTIFFVIWIYTREVRAVGAWAIWLGFLRVCTLLLVMLVWLLPAFQESETGIKTSRVLVLNDVSLSMQTSDDPVIERPGQVRRTRQDQVLELFKTDEKDFLGKLLENNPIFHYRFGQTLDPKALMVTSASRPEWAEWVNRLQLSDRSTLAAPLPRDLLDQFRMFGDRFQVSAEIEGGSAKLYQDFNRSLNESQIAANLLPRTNLAKTLEEVLAREGDGKNMVQGLIVFSDGRFNTGASEEHLKRATDLAEKQKIPLFIVGVGKHREPRNLLLAGVTAPARVEPEDEYQVEVVVNGENVPPGESATVSLHCIKPGQATMEPVDKPQGVVLTQTRDKMVSGSATFTIKDPKQLQGDYQYFARLDPIREEESYADNRNPKPVVVRVEKRKLSVLLIASAPFKDYQFLRTILMREKEKIDLSIYLQTVSDGSVQDVDPKRLLKHFPDRFSTERDGDPYNLGSYDVIVAFDADWSGVPVETQKLLRRWVEDFGGGIVFVSGTVHAYQLARDPQAADIRSLVPVVLDDTVLSSKLLTRLARFEAKDPWALNWEPPAKSAPYLNITDTTDPDKHLEGWEHFFWRSGITLNPGDVRRSEDGEALAPANRGFFTFGPLKDIKPTATVLARFGDPDERLRTSGKIGAVEARQKHPYLVQQRLIKGHTFYIGSPEIWRLRSFSPTYHERFWIKLINFMQSGRKEASSRGILEHVSERFILGDRVQVRAKFFNTQMQPIKPEDRQVLLTLKSPPGEGREEAPSVMAMTPVPGQEGYFATGFVVKRVGKYEFEVTTHAPDLKEPDVRLTHEFRVERVDEERDFTKPDFALLHRLASVADPDKLAEDKKLQAALTRARESAREYETANDKRRSDSEDENADRYFFELRDVHLIPSLISKKEEPFENKHREIDLWDLSIEDAWRQVSHYWQGLPPAERVAERDDWMSWLLSAPWALVAFVTLLSLEWLTRKLLRLA